MTAAKADADTVLQTLVRRTTPLVLTGYCVVYDELDFIGPPIIDDSKPNKIYYGVPITVRYVIAQD